MRTLATGMLGAGTRSWIGYLERDVHAASRASRARTPRNGCAPAGLNAAGGTGHRGRPADECAYASTGFSRALGAGKPFCLLGRGDGTGGRGSSLSGLEAGRQAGFGRSAPRARASLPSRRWVPLSPDLSWRPRALTTVYYLLAALIPSCAPRPDARTHARTLPHPASARHAAASADAGAGGAPGALSVAAQASVLRPPQVSPPQT